MFGMISSTEVRRRVKLARKAAKEMREENNLA